MIESQRDEANTARRWHRCNPVDDADPASPRLVLALVAAQSCADARAILHVLGLPCRCDSIYFANRFRRRAVCCGRESVAAPKVKANHVYEIRPRKDKRGFDLISEALPFGRLWYLEVR